MCFQVQLCYCLFDVHGEHFDLWHSLPLSGCSDGTKTGM